ncbi:binuclear zinc transcription factor [Thozetella sp. PMI_491]|nr:binuclear zinc transcription factor [Thozetella sp. PMI_491]
MANSARSSLEDHQKKKFSCYECKARKLKCNRVWPCQRCSHLGEDCRFPVARERPGHVAQKPRTKELEARLAVLEHRLKQQESHVPTAQNFAPPPDSGQLVSTGRFEQLPPEEIVEELVSLYFSRLYSEAPMQDPVRYLASLYRPPHMQPPLCLQYAILALAATLSPKHKDLALPFYHRSRNYLQYDEMMADGRHAITLGHAQCSVLLSNFEAQHLWHARASLSVSRSVRLAQLLGLYDVETGTSPFALAPTNDWQIREERRRTMWAIFCSDRLSSFTTTWQPLVDAKQIRTLLPASEESFHLGIAETSVTLEGALRDATASYSPFACQVLAAHLLFECLDHTFAEYPEDDTPDLRGGAFWKRQQDLDNRLAILFMAMPSSVRCPENIAKHSAVVINLSLHMSSICLRRVEDFRARSTALSAEQSPVTAARLLSSSQAIFEIVTKVEDLEALFSNPTASVSAFLAALVFVSDFATTHSRHSEECSSTLMDIMVKIARPNLATANLALQLAGYLKELGIDPAALEKVQHLATEMEVGVLPIGFDNRSAARAIFCPFH